MVVRMCGYSCVDLCTYAYMCVYTDAWVMIWES